MSKIKTIIIIESARLNAVSRRDYCAYS